MNEASPKPLEEPPEKAVTNTAENSAERAVPPPRVSPPFKVEKHLGLWRRAMRALGFLGAAGLLALPFSALVDWWKQDAPPLITALDCEVAQVPVGDQPPPLDPSQPITVGVGEKLLCGVEQEGGDYIVWRGGKNGFFMRSGPIRSAQEEQWLERVRLWIDPPSKPQVTACEATEQPVGTPPRNIPRCRHAVDYSAPGNHVLTARVSKRGNPHVEELTLPIRVVDTQTVLRLRSIQISPPPGSREGTRTGSVDEMLNAPSNPFAAPREETRPVRVIQAGQGETFVQGSARLSVRSSNGSSATLQVTPDAVTALVHLRSGPGFDQRRAWFAAEVSASVRSEVSIPPIAVGPVALRAPGRRQVYSQPIPAGASVRVKFADNREESLALGAWSSPGPYGSRVRFLQTEDGLVAETAAP